MNKSKCRCGHSKRKHHLIEGKRTWCYDCECIEYNKKEILDNLENLKERKGG